MFSERCIYIYFFFELKCILIRIMGCFYFIIMVLAALSADAAAKPIMVSFGTNNGPIQPPRETTTTQLPPPEDRRAPAPVNERFEDVPNPSVYKPLRPLQYRKRLLSFRPNPNLILGTAQDQKYFPSSAKFYQYKRDKARALGLDYRGPHLFELQAYQLENQQREQRRQQRQEEPKPTALFKPVVPVKNRDVPQIGVVYSSGLRYYVPQFSIYDDGAWEENEI